LRYLLQYCNFAVRSAPAGAASTPHEEAIIAAEITAPAADLRIRVVLMVAMVAVAAGTRLKPPVPAGFSMPSARVLRGACMPMPAC
jgi:hypothetical protein